MLYEHGGKFDPSKISSRALGQEPSEKCVYLQLNKLLLPGGLCLLVERSLAIAWPPLLFAWSRLLCVSVSPLFDRNENPISLKTLLGKSRLVGNHVFTIFKSSRLEIPNQNVKKRYHTKFRPNRLKVRDFPRGWKSPNLGRDL